MDAATNGRRRDWPVGGVRPEFIARVRRQRDRIAHQALGLIPVDAAALESLEGRLIGCGGRDVGAGPEVIHVHRADGVRRFDQAFGRPERVAKVGAAPLELGRERPVQHDDRAASSTARRSDSWVDRRAGFDSRTAAAQVVTA